MDIDSFDLVRQLAASQFLVRSLHVVAELGVADHVDEKGTSISQIARKVGTDADALGRVVRLLSSRTIFELVDDVVWHTAASRFLQTNHPASSGRWSACSPSQSNGMGQDS